MAKKTAKVKEKDIPTRQAFVVMESGFEYDDNYYNQEGDGGAPVKVYLDKQRAEEACLKKNIEELLSGKNWSEYSWRLRESDGSEKVKEAVTSAKGKYKTDKDDYEFYIEELPNDVTETQVDAIIDALGVTLFKVEEIELEMFIV